MSVSKTIKAYDPLTRLSFCSRYYTLVYLDTQLNGYQIQLIVQSVPCLGEAYRDWIEGVDKVECETCCLFQRQVCHPIDRESQAAIVVVVLAL